MNLDLSDLSEMIGLVKAAIASYEAHKARAMAGGDGAFGSAQLVAHYSSELCDLRRLLVKLQAMSGGAK